jgi:hypothetical protein
MPYPTRSEASGIWQLNEIAKSIRGNDWPTVSVPIEYLVIAGGGGGGGNGTGAAAAGGGGAGGYRTNYTSSAPTTHSERIRWRWVN